MKYLKSINSKLSFKNKGRVSRLSYRIGLKPTVNRNMDRCFEIPIVVFSADFEMAWAFRYSKIRRKIAADFGLKERKNVPVLINLFDNYEIPITWATVGHLFLSQCSKDQQGLAHSDMPRPPYFENRNWQYLNGDWYQNDPCSDYLNEPAWYAPDLIDLIIGSKVQHEIGCHTFSHVDFSYDQCPADVASAELNACIELANQRGLSLKSMVFPGGTFGNYEVLAKKGFICYRKPAQFKIDMPYIDKNGLVAIPSSFGLDKDPYGWSNETHLLIFKRFIDKLIRSKMLCHFWFHPSMDEQYLNTILPQLLKWLVREREKGNLVILTMKNIAEKVLQNA